MIAGTFTDTDNKIHFRAKSSQYWITRIFPQLVFSLPENIRQKNGQVLVFDADRFIELDATGVREILQLVESLEPAHKEVYALEDLPFWIISAEQFCIDSLNSAKLPEPRYFKLSSPHQVLTLAGNQRKIEDWIIDLQVNHYTQKDVRIRDFSNFFIEGLPPVGEGSIISSGVTIVGDSSIGQNVHLYPNVYVENSDIGDHCTIFPGCVIRDSRIESNVQAGPYTHLRYGVVLKQNTKVGNFVELKKSTLGEGSKAMHLSYIGDCQAGEKVNFGAGTITCNYDGEKKSPTIIEDQAFIGSGTQLVAPVTIGRSSYIGAGSTITKNVPPCSLAIAREKQRNILDWVTRQKSKKK